LIARVSHGYNYIAITRSYFEQISLAKMSTPWFRKESRTVVDHDLVASRPSRKEDVGTSA
ncbi:unnamed protein product, partial [Ceratitis capitata]